MDTDLYMIFIRKTIKEEGMQVADKANKIALENRQITIAQYSKDASIIAKEILKR